MLPAMDLTLILRDTPVIGDAAHKLLYSLCPRKILYTTDFGGRSLPKKRDLTKHSARLDVKIAATRDIVPFNGASEICPVLPSYLFSGPLDAETRGNAIGEAFRLFPDVKTVYFDLGVHINIESAQKMEVALIKFRPDVKLGVIASLRRFEDDRELLDWVLATAHPCPFMLPDASLKENLDRALATCGPLAEVFCAYIPKAEAEDFAVTVAASLLPLFVFWSPLSAINIGFTEKSSCEEPPAPVSEYRDMRALFTSIVWSRKSTSSDVVGGINVSDVVRVLPFPPDADGTAYGKVVLADDSVYGYIVLRHFSQIKFEEVEKNHA